MNYNLPGFKLESNGFLAKENLLVSQITVHSNDACFQLSVNILKTKRFKGIFLYFRHSMTSSIQHLLRLEIFPTNYVKPSSTNGSQTTTKNLTRSKWM